MGYTVSFYTFTKRSNSTKVPTSGNNDFTCNIKNGSGILTPKVELNLGLTSDPSQYNYCHITDFDRWYYVTEWYFDHGLWTATCKVDVLATYKSQIGSTSMYVLRSSAQKDGSIVDTLYSMKTGCTFQHNTAASPYQTSGTYIIGVVSPVGDYGSITYHAVSASGLATICNYLISSAVDSNNGFDLSDASMALQASLIDPIQYIKSVMFFPFPMTDFDLQTATTSIDIFKWNITSVLAARISSNRVNKTLSLSITKHPSTTGRGNYVNQSPYTVLTLYAPPFGVIEIDTTVSCNASTLSCDIDVDPISGRGILRVKCNGVILNQMESQIGVPIQVSQVTRDFIGGVTSALGGVANAVQGAYTGNFAGAITGVMSGIGDAVKALTPRSQTVGTGGGFSSIYPYAWQLDHQFFTPVDDDNSQNGRPYCQMATPSSLGGYMLIQEGDVPIPGTKAEADEIRMLLEGGFYYE